LTRNTKFLKRGTGMHLFPKRPGNVPCRNVDCFTGTLLIQKGCGKTAGLPPYQKGEPVSEITDEGDHNYFPILSNNNKKTTHTAVDQANAISLKRISIRLSGVVGSIPSYREKLHNSVQGGLSQKPRVYGEERKVS